MAINSKQELRYYQVALNTTDRNVLDRKLRPLQSIKDSYPKYLLTLDDFDKEANYDGIKKLSMIDWLLEKY